MNSKHGCIFPTSLYPCPYNGVSHIFLLNNEFFPTLWIWTALCPGLARKCSQSDAITSFNSRPEETSQTYQVPQRVNNIRIQGNERHRARELWHPICQPQASEAIPDQLSAAQSCRKSRHPTSQFGTKPQELPSRPQIPKARKWLSSQVSGWGLFVREDCQ